MGGSSDEKLVIQNLRSVTDSICLPSASIIRNTLFLFAISSFIRWCISKRKQKREAVSQHRANTAFFAIFDRKE